MRYSTLRKLAPALLTLAGAAFMTGARGCDEDPPITTDDAGPPIMTDGSVSPAACVVGGCSGTVCTDNPDDAITTCEWREEYACYREATCERQSDGNCGWTDTRELQACLDHGGPVEPPGPCHVGGCSNQLCSDEPGLSSTCEWREEYACYRDAACERQTDGSCGWTQTSDLQACLDNDGPLPEPEPQPDACYVGGCSSQICSAEQGVSSTCEWLEEYACYRSATCERQASGECGWTQTEELEACLDGGTPSPEPPSRCVVAGCSGQVCTDDPGVATTCEWRAEYACYHDAECQRQTDGACGWTQTDELQACIDAARE